MSFSIFHFGQSLDKATWSPWQFPHFGSFWQSSKLCPSSPHPAQMALPLHEFLVCPNSWHWKHLWGLVMYGCVSFSGIQYWSFWENSVFWWLKRTDCNVWWFFWQLWFLVAEVLFWFHFLPLYPVPYILWQILMNLGFCVMKLSQVNSQGAWLSSGDFYIAVLFLLQ